MAKRFGYLVAIAVLCLVFGLLQRRFGAEARAEKWYTYRTFAFNTDCTLQLQAKEEALAGKAAGECLHLLAEMGAALNRFDPASDVSRFNALEAGALLQCDEILWDAFAAAREASALTDGAFDVTVGPLVAYWKAVADGKAPDEESRLAALARTGMDKLAFDGERRSVTKLADGVKADFGGLAKGLALELVRQRLLAAGIEHCLLNFGGNIYVSRREGEASGVAVRDPRCGETLCVVSRCSGRFVATSSDEFRALSPGKISHIVDPRTGMSVQTMLSVTAVASGGAASDYLSTAVFVGGIPLAERIAAARPDVGFVILDGEGEVHCIGSVEVE